MMGQGLRAAIVAALVLALLLLGYGLWGDSSAPRTDDARDPVHGSSAGNPLPQSTPDGSGVEDSAALVEDVPVREEPKLSGRVESRDGIGVAGVHVIALSDAGEIRATAVTDADGRFTFDLSGRAHLGVARFDRLGTAPRAETQFRDASEACVLSFEGIAGTVAAGDGSMLMRGVVLARFAGEDSIVANAPVSADGAFAFSQLQPGRYLLTYKTHVHGSEYDMTDGGIDLEEWRTGVELRLADGAAIEGVVLDEQGKPKPRVWMRATRGSVLTGDYTDGEGRFRIDGLVPEESYLLTVWIRGFVPEQREARAGERDMRFVLDPGRMSNGVLRGSDGRSVAGRQLSFRFGPGARDLLHATTDVHGAFEIGGLPDGRIEALVSRGDWISCGTFDAGDRDVALQLPPP